MDNENVENNETPKRRFLKKPKTRTIIIASAVALTVIGGVVVLGTKVKPAEAIEAAADAVK